MIHETHNGIRLEQFATSIRETTTAAKKKEKLKKHSKKRIKDASFDFESYSSVPTPFFFG
jgi:hypothetical protein